jgi:hypothetical protein
VKINAVTRSTIKEKPTNGSWPNLSKNGQQLLPIVDLIEQCQWVCDELIEVTGRAAI